MKETSPSSCWGLTTKAMIGIAGFMILAYLVGSPETAAVVAGG